MPHHRFQHFYCYLVMTYHSNSIFQAERTRKDKVLKFLQILPRRGPRAFDKFLHSIHDHYSWISDKLRETYHKLASKTGISFVGNLSFLVIPIILLC